MYHLLVPFWKYVFLLREIRNLLDSLFGLSNSIINHNTYFMIKWTTTLLLSLAMVPLFAQADKVARNGNWNANNTWSPSGVPGNNQIILIPEGVTVRVPGSDHVLNNSKLIVMGSLVMAPTCFVCTNYGSLTFTGDESAVIITPGGEVDNGSLFGGDTHFINVNGTTFWSGNWCNSNCGEQIGSFTAEEEISWPAGVNNPLPVDLIDFDGYSEKGVNYLSWSTLSEKSNQGFVIEKSTNGVAFDSIGFVPGNGDSNQLIDYEFIDNHADPYDYYRLKQMDFDGQVEYSEIVLIERQKQIHSESERIVVYPNPVTSEIHIQSELTNYKLYDIRGEVIAEGKNTTTYWIEQHLATYLSELEPGNYILQTIKNGQVLKTRIVKN